MSLTRKMLKEMGIEDDKIEQIINAHTEVTDTLKNEHDSYKKEAEKLAEVQKKLDVAERKITESEDFRKQLEELRGEISAKETAEKKSGAFEKVLRENGYSENGIKKILKYGNYLDKIELDGNCIKNIENLMTDVESDWSEYKPSETTVYTTPSTPPENTVSNGRKSEIADYAENYYNRLYGAKKED